MDRIKEGSVDPEVLTLLKALPPGGLYLITSKTTFLLGFNAYKEDRLQSFLWTENRTVLRCVLLDASSCSVTFSITNSRLHYECDCPIWTATAQCKHVICSLLTILNLISPNLFHQTKQDEHRHQALKAALLQNQDMASRSKIAQTREEDSLSVHGSSSLPQLGERVPVKNPLGASTLKNDASTSTSGRASLLPNFPEHVKGDEIELVIESKGDYPAVFLRRKGRVVDSLMGLPEGLSVFTYRYYSDRSLQDRFFEHLTRFGNDYPLVLETEAGKIRLKWDPGLSYRSKTELNVAGEQVEIHALAILGDVVCDDVVRFWDFVVDLKTGALARVNDREGWRLFDNLDHLFRPAPHSFDSLDGAIESRRPEREWVIRNIYFKVPLLTFQSIQFNITKATLEESLSHLILKVDGLTTPPMTAKHRYRLSIDPVGEENAILRTECLLGDSEGVTTAHTFRFFTDIHAQGLPAAFKALKRLTALYECFFHLLVLKKETDATKVIKKALSNGDFTQYAVKRAARDLLKQAFSTIKEEDVRLHFNARRWFIVPNEKEKESRLYKILFDCFGPKPFKEMTLYYEIPFSTRPLYAQLPLLYAQCKAAGIELHHQGKPVQTVKWDFAFDARRGLGIDWFEIKPEIRSDGVIVSDAVWRKLLQRRGVVEENGTIHLVDADAQKIIDALALIYKPRLAGVREKKEIVQVPRMQILDWVLLRKEGVEVRLSEEDEQLIQHLTRLEKIEQITTPRNLIAKLRPYQKEGLDWLAFLYTHRFGAILADDMGLGKTLQAISLLAALKENIISSIVPDTHKNAPHLIVVPPTLLFNWEQELTRFYPRLKLYQYTGKDREARFEGYDVVLTTYALVRRDIKKLKEIPFHVIIFDEAQAVKNVYADTTGAVRQLKGLFNLVMTGTPIENHLGEYYSLIDLCLPGLLGEYDPFKSRVKLDDSPMVQVLIQRTRPFVLRRMKESVLADLPPKIETDLYLELTSEQKLLYQETVSLVSSQINSAYREKTAEQAKIIALTAIMKLRQLCVSPRLLSPTLNAGAGASPKITFLIEQLQELHQEGHSALVFSQFTSGLDLLEEALGSTGLPFCRLDGSTPTQKRKGLVKAFQEKESPSVFLLSLKAGGQGLNLTKASYVFHLDPWWNPAVENQASDRAHRIGQKQKVSIIRLLMRHTIEEKMMLLKKKKLALYEAVMGGENKVGTGYAISKVDFDFLLGG